MGLGVLEPFPDRMASFKVMGDALSQAGILQLHVSPQVSAYLSGRCLNILSSLPEVSSCLTIFQWFLSHIPLPVQRQALPTLPLKHAQYLDTAHHSAGSTQVTVPVLLPSQSTSRNRAQQASSLFVHFGGKAFLERTVPGQPLWFHYGLVSTFPKLKHIPAPGAFVLALLSRCSSSDTHTTCLASSKLLLKYHSIRGAFFKKQTPPHPFLLRACCQCMMLAVL